MIEAVENHMPEVIVIDEIGSEAEAIAAATIAQRGVQLVATAHGDRIENILNNPTLQGLLGGVERSASILASVQTRPSTLLDACSFRAGICGIQTLMRSAAPLSCKVIENQAKCMHDKGHTIGVLISHAPAYITHTSLNTEANERSMLYCCTVVALLCIPAWNPNAEQVLFLHAWACVNLQCISGSRTSDGEDFWQQLLLLLAA